MASFDHEFGVVVAEPDDMGKPKGRMPEPESPVTLFAVKGFRSWYGWLKRYADFRRMSVIGVIDFALNEQAKRDGFEAMPKRSP